MLKNNDESMGSRITIEDGFYVLRFQNDTTEVATELEKLTQVLFNSTFVLKGKVILFLMMATMFLM